MRMINLTPHPVVIYAGEEAVINQGPDGPMARCIEAREDAGTVEIAGHQVPVSEVDFEEVENLPEPEEGVVYVVSRATAEARPDRRDLYYPDIQVRDDAGRIIGCRGLAQVPPPLFPPEREAEERLRDALIGLGYLEDAPDTPAGVRLTLTRMRHALGRALQLVPLTEELAALAAVVGEPARDDAEEAGVVVVFGSAADPGTQPRDIDVVYTGPRELAEPLVAEWARLHGHEGLPVDWHTARYGPTGDIQLPAPWGQPGHAVVLHDRPEHTPVSWRPVYGLASCIRAHGQDYAPLKRLLSSQPWRLTVVPAPGEDGEWDGYVEGLTALRSATAKHPAGAEVLVDLWGPLMQRLLVEDPQPQPSAHKDLAAGSPMAAGGALVITLQPDGTIVQPHAPRAVGELERLLYA